ncbi:hypothetical protein AYO44_13820 [Planctomycetaceae bacterium SCGC AG-212-F19]|nr:hypothetical protein AYO44_13820 [Planctomycetaceae bacterium SCGC AG-212-F19]
MNVGSGTMKRAILLICVVSGSLAGLGAYYFRPQPKPEYGWLVFGPDLSVRVLITMRGEAVTLEHYINGQPTGRRERFADRSELKDVTIDDPDGKTTYTITSLSGTLVGEGVPTELFASVTIRGPLNYRQYCDLRMTDTSGTAHLAHFHGPLTVGVRTINWEVPAGLAIRRGDKPTQLQVGVGTMNAKQGCWVVVRTQEDDQSEFPDGVHPFVDIEFPARQAADPSIRRRYSLNKVC